MSTRDGTSWSVCVKNPRSRENQRCPQPAALIGPKTTTTSASPTQLSGEIVLEQRLSTDETGITALIDTLIDHDVTAVAIEKPDGLLVGRLLGAGQTVLAMHPNQVKAARDRFRAAGGQERPLRRPSALRAGTHRSSPLPRPDPAARRDRGAARPAQNSPGPRRGPRRAGQPAARPAARLLARRRSDLCRGRFPDRAGLHHPLPNTPPTPRAWPPNDWPPSWPATTTAAAATPSELLDPTARRADRSHRRARDRGASQLRAWPDRRAHTDRRSDRPAEQPDRRSRP